MKNDNFNIPASIRQKLLNYSRQRKLDFNLVLNNYGLERLLYRIGKSRYAKQFILKGALLFSFYEKLGQRPTRDMDLLGVGNIPIESLVPVFQEICRIEDEDGIVFLPKSVKAADIREAMEYGGSRISVAAELAGAKIDLQIDVGFGDAVTPTAKLASYPTFLQLPKPKIRIYPWETVIAEKFQAMVNLGIANSRMKDFYDIWIISRNIEFNGETLSKALKKTFNRRKTELPTTLPLAISNEFYADTRKKIQWTAFINRTKLKATGALSTICKEIAQFIMPIINAAEKGDPFLKKWQPKGPWK